MLSEKVNKMKNVDLILTLLWHTYAHYMQDLLCPHAIYLHQHA